MTLLDKLNPEQVTTLLLKKDERATYALRACNGCLNKQRQRI
jgi:hypothetical protein